jgi:hypothetical protein
MAERTVFGDVIMRFGCVDEVRRLVTQSIAPMIGMRIFGERQAFQKKL